MSLVEIPDKALEKTVEVLGQPLAETYNYVINAPVKKVSNFVCDIFDIVLKPFGYLKDKENAYFDSKLTEYKKELIERIEKIPDEKLTDPNYHTISLAIDNSKYCFTNDDLRKMFVNLIGKTLDSDYSNKIHPAFSEIIKQMSTLDALLLKELYDDEDKPIIKILKKYGDEGSILLIDNLILSEYAPDASYESLRNSITNLDRLGLADIDYTEVLCDESLYYELYHIPITYEEGLSDEQKEIRSGIVRMTSLGNSFAKICIYD